MKKGLVLIIICLLLVGCGNIKKEENNEKPKKEVEKYSLVSTDNRLVFKNENSYEVVYYENGIITKVESAIKFDTKEEAERYYKEESFGSSETISYIYDVFIVEETEDYWEDFKDLTKDALINYMEEAEYEYVSN